MKKTCLVLATLTTLILMSCNYTDNSISSAEDLNLPQTTALKTALQSNKVSALFSDDTTTLGMTMIKATTDTPPPATRGCRTVSGSPSTMSVNAAYTYGLTVQYMSNWVYFNFSGAPNSPATSHQFVASGSSGGGTFPIDFVRIVCGSYYGDFTPLSPSNIYTTAFKGYVNANENCAVAFVGRCTGTSYGGGNCTLNLSNWTGTVCY